MKSGRFGSLDAIIVDPKQGQTVEQTVVLLHGYGAPGTDLVGLAAELGPARPTRFVFFQAPHVPAGMGSGPQAGRAWWDIDMVQLQIMMMTQSYDLFASSHPPGLDEATSLLTEALRELCEQTKGEFEQVYVGGFSQGAMLSCNWALMSQEPIAGLIQLSGTVLCEETWRGKLATRKGMKVFQSHSPDDPVLPYELATRLGDMFTSAETAHTWIPFRGGHGIGPSVVTALKAFLE